MVTFPEVSCGQKLSPALTVRSFAMTPEIGVLSSPLSSSLVRTCSLWDNHNVHIVIQGAYHAMRLPIIALACKADLESQVEPEYASNLLKQYRAGLVEVTVTNDVGRDKLKRSFDWLLKAVFRHRRSFLNLPSRFNVLTPFYRSDRYNKSA
jgi:hypothetical protein